jgi:hypothetical protein
MCVDTTGNWVEGELCVLYVGMCVWRNIPAEITACWSCWSGYGGFVYIWS